MKTSKGEKPVSYSTRIGRQLIDDTLEIGKHLKAAESSGIADQPALYNWMITVS